MQIVCDEFMFFNPEILPPFLPTRIDGEIPIMEISIETVGDPIKLAMIDDKSRNVVIKKKKEFQFMDPEVLSLLSPTLIQGAKTIMESNMTPEKDDTMMIVEDNFQNVLNQKEEYEEEEEEEVEPFYHINFSLESLEGYKKNNPEEMRELKDLWNGNNFFFTENENLDLDPSQEKKKHCNVVFSQRETIIRK